MPFEKQVVTQYRWRCSRCSDATGITAHVDLPPGWCRLARYDDICSDASVLYELCPECTTQWNDRFLTGEQLTDV